MQNENFALVRALVGARPQSATAKFLTEEGSPHEEGSRGRLESAPAV
jgi:hypothetical protein